MPVIASGKCRRTETPNAVMTTLASPTQGGSHRQAVWCVEMRAGQAGPAHSFDDDQVWAILEGAATVKLADQSFEVSAGDVIVIRAGVPRAIAADRESALRAVVAAPAGCAATLADGTPRGVPDWIA